MSGRFLLAALVAASLALAGCIEMPQDAAQDDSGPVGAGFASAAASEPPCRPLDMEGGFGGGQGADGQDGVSNTPGAFSYGGQALLKTDTERYAWQNPSDGFTVSWGGQMLLGEITVRVYDACDELLFEETLGMLQQGGSFETPPRGTAGEWVVELDFALATGQMGLSVTSA